MKHFRWCSFFFAAVLGLVSGSCRKQSRDPLTGANGEPVIYASIPPLAGLAQKIAGDEIEVRTLVGENQDPHDFSPTPKQLVDLSRSAAFLTAGMPFEESLAEKLRDSSRGLRIIDVTEGIELLSFDDHAHHDHDHDDDHDHDHSGPDPHVWLSPPLLKKQADTLAKALTEIAPENAAAAIRERREKLVDEIDALHAELMEKLAPLRGQRFYVYHGAFAYFADAYGLVQEAIEIGGRQPEQKRIYALIEWAKKDGVRMIFVQPQFDPTSAETIAEAIGGEVMPVDPLEPDVIANLRKIADTISSMRAKN